MIAIETFGLPDYVRPPALPFPPSWLGTQLATRLAMTAFATSDAVQYPASPNTETAAAPIRIRFFLHTRAKPK